MPIRACMEIESTSQLKNQKMLTVRTWSLFQTSTPLHLTNHPPPKLQLLPTSKCCNEPYFFDNNCFIMQNDSLMWLKTLIFLYILHHKYDDIVFTVLKCIREGMCCRKVTTNFSRKNLIGYFVKMSKNIGFYTYDETFLIIPF